MTSHHLSHAPQQRATKALHRMRHVLRSRWMASAWLLVLVLLPVAAQAYQCRYADNTTNLPNTPWVWSGQPLRIPSDVAVGQSLGVVATVSFPQAASVQYCEHHNGFMYAPIGNRIANYYLQVNSSYLLASGTADSNGYFIPSGIQGIALRVTMTSNKRYPNGVQLRPNVQLAWNMPTYVRNPIDFNASNSFFYHCNWIVSTPADNQNGNTCYWNPAEQDHRFMVEAIRTGEVTPGAVLTSAMLPQVEWRHQDQYTTNAQGTSAYATQIAYRLGGATGGSPPSIPAPKTCTVTSGSANQSVTLQTVRVSDFGGSPTVAGATPFNIVLDCSGSGGAMRLAMSDASGATNDFGMLNPFGGTAGNVRIQVRRGSDCSGNMPLAGANTDVGTVPAGTRQYTIPMCARYIQPGGASPTAGTIFGRVTFAITYE